MTHRPAPMRHAEPWLLGTPGYSLLAEGAVSQKILAGNNKYLYRIHSHYLDLKGPHFIFTHLSLENPKYFNLNFNKLPGCFKSVLSA
ncbi:hypothetical protein NDU88_002472 [Pleurodeles waltl]|uniref:Uncharacterized protein n=1 Tax=Pleurodeles waltl TaxID=8319 RepID=A0AAV7TL77_PLEWA|nr:hypothetical protein NDU88_002472 [Pleurodeles waltl]